MIQVYSIGRLSVEWLDIPKDIIKSVLQKGEMGHFWYFGGTNYYVYFTSFIAYPLQTDVIQTFRVWTWLFYFLLGSFIEEITSQLKNKIRFDVHLILTVVVTGIVLAFHYYVGTRVILLEGRILKAEYFYDSISDVIWVVLFFSLLLRINLCKRVEEFIRKFASLTLGIYIINFPLRLIVAHIIKVNSLTEAVFFG